MTYDEFLSGISNYSELFYGKGLKKQANKLLFEFAEGFKKNVPQAEGDEILCRFCRELLDEGKFPELWLCSSPKLPFQLTGLLNDCLNRECAQDKMPQMRWAYQLFGRYYNPHDPKNEHDPYDVLERAYAHAECDQATVDLYFSAQLHELDFGAHHFPEGCCISRELYADCVSVCERILSEKTVSPEMEREFRDYKTLYEIYFKWSDGGRSSDFAELCARAGLDFAPVETFYYS